MDKTYIFDTGGEQIRISEEASETIMKLSNEPRKLLLYTLDEVVPDKQDILEIQAAIRKNIGFCKICRKDGEGEKVSTIFFRKGERPESMTFNKNQGYNG